MQGHKPLDTTPHRTARSIHVPSISKSKLDLPLSTAAAATNIPNNAQAPAAAKNCNPSILGRPPPWQQTPPPSKPVLVSPAVAMKPTSTPAPPLERERLFLRPKKKGGARRKPMNHEAAREALHAAQAEFFCREMVAAPTATTGEEQVGQQEESALAPAAAPPLEPERRFLNAKKKGARRKPKNRETAREALRASQAEFFLKEMAVSAATEAEGKPVVAEEEDVKGGGFEERREEETDAEMERRSGKNLTSNKSLRSKTSTGERRSKINTCESLRSSCNKKLKVTSQHAFKLRTEQRAKVKEQQLGHKVREILVEEKKKRVHTARRLPWTTDEPQRLIKPSVKARTEPIDVVLHSDMRALGRAEYDKYVLARKKFHEQQKLEWVRQQELEEEERIRKLRRTELIPKAQPLPYFDRCFNCKRLTKPATFPVEQKFCIRPE